MNSLDAYEKRLRDETATVEAEIESCNQQLEVLNKRLEGLRRAAELFESEQGAVTELLQTTANGGVLFRGIPNSRANKAQTDTTSRKSSNVQKGRAPQNRTKISPGPGNRSARQNGGLTRVDMIAAVLKRHPRRTVRELIALLDRNTGGRPRKARLPAISILTGTNSCIFRRTAPQIDPSLGRRSKAPFGTDECNPSPFGPGWGAGRPGQSEAACHS